MYIKQLSIFIENKSGRLAEITKILSDSGTNIHALSIADTTDFGILRLIVDNPDEAIASLKEKGLTAKITRVIGISVDHQPGGLNKVLTALDEAGITVEYMYAFTGRNKNAQALVILRLDKMDEAGEILKETDMPVVNADAIKEWCN